MGKMLKIAPQIRLRVQCVADEDWGKESCLEIFGFETLQIYPSLVSHVHNMWNFHQPKLTPSNEKGRVLQFKKFWSAMCSILNLKGQSAKHGIGWGGKVY